MLQRAKGLILAMPVADYVSLVRSRRDRTLGPFIEGLPIELFLIGQVCEVPDVCLLYTSDAADERSSVDLGGRRIIKKKKNIHSCEGRSIY